MNIWNYDICVWHPPTLDTCPNFLCKRNYLPLDELNKFQTVSRKLNEDYNLFALSTDTKEAHEAFCNLEMTEGGLNGLNIPLISDKNAKICKKLNIFDSTSHRAFPSYVLLNNCQNKTILQNFLISSIQSIN